MTEQTTPQALKPRKGSFIFPRVVAGTIASAVLSGAASLGLAAAAPHLTILALVFLALLFVLTVASAFVAYRKEHYELHPAHIRCRRGGLLSDHTTELDIRNITHVKIRLPWLRFKLFGIGHVFIETAGTSEPAVLRYVRDPESVYGHVRDLMKENGYTLGQRELLHEERPALIGVIVDTIGIIFGLAFLLFWVATALAPLVTTMPEGSGMPDVPPALRSLAASAFILLALGGFTFFIIHFLNLRRRTYRVYDDAVVYEEGFLTRNNAFIPYENIADAETKRTLVDQILGLYDVQISCQGSSSEIKFRRLRNGVALSTAIDDLVVRAREKPNPREQRRPDAEPGVPPPLPTPQHPAAEFVPPSQAWTAELKMSGARVLIPALVGFIIPPVGIILTIRGIVGLIATSYAVKASSVRQSFRFLSTDEREFAYEKITGLIVKRNPWDRLFGTLTVRLWSIGSGRAIELAHVKARQLDLDALKRQVGIPEASPEPLSAPASFGPLVFVRGRLIQLVAVSVFTALLLATFAFPLEPEFRLLSYILLGVAAAITLVGFFYSWVYHSRQRLTFHPQHVEAAQGVLVRTRYFVCYRNVKKTLLTRYPGGDTGRLQIFVAGEEEAIKGKQGNEGGGMRKPCSFTSDFLPGIAEKQLLVDDIVAARVPAEPDAGPAEPFELVHESPRAVGNSVVKLFLLCLLPPVLVSLPLALPLCIIGAKRYRYRVESGRVLVTWGILFRHQASVLLDRIDSLQHSQGPLNKMFGNGNVTIMTAGSSKPDLTLVNSPGYNTLYDEIRQRSSSSV